MATLKPMARGQFDISIAEKATLLTLPTPIFRIGQPRRMALGPNVSIMRFFFYSVKPKAFLKGKIGFNLARQVRPKNE
jgi:hypothetical protein